MHKLPGLNLNSTVASAATSGLLRQEQQLANKNNDGSGDVTVLNGDIVATSGLDSAATSNALTINGDVELCLDCVSNLSVGNEPKSWPSSPMRASTVTERLPSRAAQHFQVSNTLLFALSDIVTTLLAA